MLGVSTSGYYAWRNRAPAARTQADQRLCGITPSMSRRGNCYDNAMMESFWTTLKTELFGAYVPATKAEARLLIFEYIELYYNRHRKHSALGFKSPVDFEAQFRYQQN